jgi:hypothetical protein
MATWVATFTGNVVAEVWASGGSGFVGNNAPLRGGGGGGGAYARKTLHVTLGVSYTYQVGAAVASGDGQDSSFNGDSGLFVLAQRGHAAAFLSPGVRGLASGSTGDVKEDGVDGGDAGAGDFTLAPGFAGGAAAHGGGAGGAGGGIDGNGQNGSEPGGGGGGGGATHAGTSVQGGGARGAVQVWRADRFGAPGALPILAVGNPPALTSPPKHHSFIMS